MAYFIRLERTEDLEWLQSILNNSIAKLREGSSMLMAASENIVRVHDAVINAVPAKEGSVLGITEEFPGDIKVPAKKPAKKEKPQESEWMPNLCKTHPKNEIKRVPRTDCQGCWAAYKKLHPMKYDKAKRDFERRAK